MKSCKNIRFKILRRSDKTVQKLENKILKIIYLFSMYIIIRLIMTKLNHKNKNS